MVSSSFKAGITIESSGAATSFFGTYSWSSGSSSMRSSVPSEDNRVAAFIRVKILTHVVAAVYDRPAFGLAFVSLIQPESRHDAGSSQNGSLALGRAFHRSARRSGNIGLGGSPMVASGSRPRG